MIVVYNPQEPATELMREYHQRELDLIKHLGMPVRPVECSLFGITDKKRPKLEGSVFIRHYAGQHVYYRQYVSECGGRLIVPQYWRANEWWYNTPEPIQKKYFGRLFGYQDLRRFGYIDEMAQVKDLNATLERLFDQYAYQGHLFLKAPDKGSLPAALYDLEDAKEQVGYWLAVPCHKRLGTLIWSQPMAIGGAPTKYGKAEYRCFIVDNKCSTISIYTDEQSQTKNCAAIEAFANDFAQSSTAHGNLPHAYCLDIAELQDGRLAVVELNDIAASGFFADHDIKKLYEDLEASA